MQHSAMKDYVSRDERVGDKVVKKKEKNPWNLLWALYAIFFVSTYGIYFFSNGLVIQ